jgi:aspartate kinase
MLEIIVCKFGGSSLADAEQIRKAEAIIRADPRRRVVVVSAPGKAEGRKYKVTDMLYNLYFQTHDADNKEVDYKKIDDMSASEILNEIKAIYLEISSGLGLDGNTYSQCMSELEQLLADSSSAHHDLASRGENFNARLIAEYLDADFADAADLIYITDESPDGDNEATMQRISELKYRERKVVISGFYGTTSLQGRVIRTFERGGSDLTQTDVAAGLYEAGVDVICENRTDQPGIRCCDPKLFPEEERDSIRTIKKMSFRETRELTYMGFEVFNDKAIGPARRRNIPIYVLDSKNPDHDSGTCISSEYDESQLIRGIAGTNGFCSFNIEKYMMDGIVGFGRDLLDIFARRGLSYEHAPSGIDNISVIIEQKQVEGIEEEIKEEIKRKMNPDHVDILPKLALIAVVGEGMRHHVGLASQITTALADAGVNIEVLNQGASESNIIVGVRDCDYKPAVKALYNEFFGGR